MGKEIRITSGPAIERAGDLAAILTNLKEGDVLFLDEIHRINKTIEEYLYPAMEDYKLNLILGKGPNGSHNGIKITEIYFNWSHHKAGIIISSIKKSIWRNISIKFLSKEDVKKIIERRQNY